MRKFHGEIPMKRFLEGDSQERRTPRKRRIPRENSTRKFHEKIPRKGFPLRHSQERKIPTKPEFPGKENSWERRFPLEIPTGRDSTSKFHEEIPIKRIPKGDIPIGDSQKENSLQRFPGKKNQIDKKGEFPGKENSQKSSVTRKRENSQKSKTPRKRRFSLEIPI